MWSKSNCNPLNSMYYNYNWISPAHMLLKMRNGEMIMKQEITKKQGKRALGWDHITVFLTMWLYDWRFVLLEGLLQKFQMRIYGSAKIIFSFGFLQVCYTVLQTHQSVTKICPEKGHRCWLQSIPSANGNKSFMLWKYVPSMICLSVISHAQCMLYDYYEFLELASWVQILSRDEFTAEIDLK